MGPLLIKPAEMMLFYTGADIYPERMLTSMDFLAPAEPSNPPSAVTVTAEVRTLHNNVHCRQPALGVSCWPAVSPSSKPAHLWGLPRAFGKPRPSFV